MKTLPALLVLLLVSSAILVRADANADALQKLALIPDPPMIITQDQTAKSPSLVLTDKGAFINRGNSPVPFDQILVKLAALPKEAWPFGRVILYYPKPVGMAGVSAPPQAMVDKVEADLTSANIRLKEGS